MRAAFIDTLMGLAGADPDIWLVTGDLGFSVLEPFAERFSSRFINAGIAEQNMTGMAAGIALSGKVVFTYSIANFQVMRALEQIRNDICHHDLNVKIVAVGGGMAYGASGHTHYATEDLAVMRSLPNMTVLAPGDPWEAAALVKAAASHSGPCYIRLGKGGDPFVHASPLHLDIGQSIALSIGESVTLIASGGALPEAVQAAAALSDAGKSVGVVSMPCLVPLDTARVLAVASHSKWIVTVEEHSGRGGLGEAVAGVLARNGARTCRLATVHLKDMTTGSVGSLSYLRRSHRVDAHSLFALVMELMSSSD